MKKEIEDIEVNESKSESSIIYEDSGKKLKRGAIFEMLLFFILGILIGITIKTEAVKKITIGFSDYKIASGKSSYDIESMKRNLEQQQAEAIQAAQQTQQEQIDNQAESEQLQQ
ncbi:MAG TPA: hypothetical protein P5548_02300 [Candidatus Moranbacteria bacterium]|nr:hypothetical protein [Candidatus Moranbacteria bacterium]HRZ33701.1 hypothetical protein [Candidatus Moranbacteria bacterium]